MLSFSTDCKDLTPQTGRNGQFCVCRNERAQLVRIKNISFKDRHLYKCTYCGTVQLFPYPISSNDDDRCYQSDNYLKRISEKEHYGYFHVMLEYIQSTLNLDKEAYILDFGSGYSYYQRFFLKEGFKNVHSVEINKHLVQFARKELQLENVHDNLKGIGNKKYDLIIANQVLEHIYDPVELINRSFYDLLKDTGVVCATVPNQGSFNRFLLRGLWIGYCPESHIWFFDKNSLYEIFKDSKRFGITDIVVKSAVNTMHDGFVPSSFLKRMYYKTFMSLFEFIGKGDQLIIALRKS